MFSSVTNQMSSWLGGFSKKPPEVGETSGNEGSEHSDKDGYFPDSKTDTPTSQKSVKGSLDGQDDASSVTGGADSSVASGELSPSDEKTPLTSGVSDKLNQSAKSFGNFLSSALNRAGKTVTEAGTKLKKSVADNSVMSDFYRDNEAYAGSLRKHGPAPAPWTGHAQEAELRQQILSLSTEKRNFVRCPPAGVQFQFDLDTYLPVAATILKDDDQLQQIRYELVPKVVTEEQFWRNYFYRVSLVTQATELGALASSGHGQVRSNDSSPASSSPEPTTPDDDDDAAEAECGELLAADEATPSARDLEEVRTGVRQLGVNKKDDQQSVRHQQQQQQQQRQQQRQQQQGAGVRGDQSVTSSAAAAAPAAPPAAAAAGCRPVSVDGDWEADMQQMLDEEEVGGGGGLVDQEDYDSDDLR